MTVVADHTLLLNTHGSSVIRAELAVEPLQSLSSDRYMAALSSPAKVPPLASLPSVTVPVDAVVMLALSRHR